MVVVVAVVLVVELTVRLLVVMVVVGLGVRKDRSLPGKSILRGWLTGGGCCWLDHPDFLAAGPSFA